MSLNSVETLLNTKECPICMDLIGGCNNVVITECGHVFHCSCLMQNTSHNGFSCPYCRSQMAEEVKEDESDLDSFGYESMFDDNALTSFRLFHQQLLGEEVEEVEEDEEEEYRYMEWATGEEISNEFPKSDYVSQKLIERSIQYEDLVKCLLYLEHGLEYDKYQDCTDKIYGQIRAVISRYEKPEEVEMM